MDYDDMFIVSAVVACSAFIIFYDYDEKKPIIKREDFHDEDDLEDKDDVEDEVNVAEYLTLDSLLTKKIDVYGIGNCEFVFDKRISRKRYDIIEFKYGLCKLIQASANTWIVKIGDSKDKPKGTLRICKNELSDVEMHKILEVKRFPLNLQ